MQKSRPPSARLTQQQPQLGSLIPGTKGQTEPPHHTFTKQTARRLQEDASHEQHYMHYRAPIHPSNDPTSALPAAACQPLSTPMRLQAGRARAFPPPSAQPKPLPPHATALCFPGPPACFSSTAGTARTMLGGDRLMARTARKVPRRLSTCSSARIATGGKGQH